MHQVALEVDARRQIIDLRSRFGRFDASPSRYRRLEWETSGQY